MNDALHLLLAIGVPMVMLVLIYCTLWLDQDKDEKD